MTRLQFPKQSGGEKMRIIERIYPVGPWLTDPVTAIVVCTPEEAEQLPGVRWHGLVGPEYRAYLEGRDLKTANAIMALATGVGR